jgi:hypothetical protein
MGRIPIRNVRIEIETIKPRDMMLLKVRIETDAKPRNIPLKKVGRVGNIPSGKGPSLKLVQPISLRLKSVASASQSSSSSPSPASKYSSPTRIDDFSRFKDNDLDGPTGKCRSMMTFIALCLFFAFSSSTDRSSSSRSTTATSSIFYIPETMTDGRTDDHMKVSRG